MISISSTLFPALTRIAVTALALLLTAPFASGAQTAASNAVAFMYHRFGESAFPSTSVRLSQFEAHLEYLDEAGYTVRPLEWIVARLKAGQPVPDRSIAITIDDAYLSIYTEAFPRLRQRGWPFIVFVAVDPVDKGLPNYLDWDQMREMQRHGATFANHSSTHDHLVRRLPDETAEQWRQRVTDDIDRAQRRLEAELGSAPMLFAYPYGEYSTELARIVRDLGYVGFGQHSGALGSLSDLRALPRFPMAESFANIGDFRSKAASLALPVLEIQPWDPVVTGAAAPVMTLRLAASDARLSELACFASHAGRIEITRVDGTDRVYTTQALEPLPRGRSRYNCTAPSSNQAGRFYWFSQPWLRLP